MRFMCSLAAALAVSAALPVAAQVDRTASRQTRARAVAYQGAGTDQRESFSRKITIRRNGRFSVHNIAGDIVITGGSGDEVSIEAVKRTRGDRRELMDVTIEVDAGSERVDVRTVYPNSRVRFGGRPGPGRGQWNGVRVDYTITLPSSVDVEAKSVSGAIKVTGVQGLLRAETVSGDVVTSATPNLELAKSVSGGIDISDISTDRSVSATSISGTLRARNVKTRSLTLNTVSGDTTVTDAACDRVDIRSIGGAIEYTGSLSKNGRHELTSHSGTIRLTLPDSTGFALSAVTFSGNIRSDLPLTIGSDTGRGRGGRFGGMGRSLQGTFRDGSAALALRTFSGDIVIAKR